MTEKAPENGGITALVVDRPVAVSMIVLAIAVFGYVSFGKLSVTLLPEISYPSLTVRTEYPGSAPAEVEELVTKPLESNLAVIGSLTGYRSISRAGVSDVILEFEWNTDMSFAAQDVREKVDQVRAFLPDDVKKPLLLKYDPTLDPVLRLGLFGELPLDRIRFVAEEIVKKRLENVAGVAAVKVRGGFESEIRVDLSERALRRARVTIDDIRSRLAEENVNLASGLLREGDTDYLVRTLNEFKSVEEIADMIVAVREGTLVRLSDVAEVHRQRKEPDVISRVDGRKSVEIAIFKEDGANIVEVAKRIKETAFGSDSGNDERQRQSSLSGTGPDDLTVVDELPDELAMRLLSDRSRFIERSIEEVEDSGIYGAGVAVLVLLLFLGRFLPTMIIAISIPVSVIATFGPMMRFDVSLNIMSLGGLALGIGMLVDASIVVLESIDRCRLEGDPPRTAAIRGTREVAGAVVASVLTTVAVFFPIVFVEGIAGEIFKDQSLTVVFSLLASLGVALFFIPMLGARSFVVLGDGDRAGPWWRNVGRLVWRRSWSRFDLTRGIATALSRSSRLPLPVRAFLTLLAVPVFLATALVELVGKLPFVVIVVALALVRLVVGIPLLIVAPLTRLAARCATAVLGFVTNVYRHTLVRVLEFRGVVVLLAIALGWFAWTAALELGVDLVPEMHSGEIIIESRLPVGTSLESNGRKTLELERRILEIDEEGRIEATGISSVIGVARDEIAPAGDGPHSARVFVRLPPTRDMRANEDRVVEKIRGSIARSADAGDLAFGTPKLFSFKAPIEIQVRGESLASLDDLGRRLERRLGRIEGLADLRTTVQKGNPEFVIRYDRVLLAERGLKLADVAAVLRDKVKGVVPTRYSETSRNRKIDVLVKIPDEAIDSVRALREIEVARVEDRSITLGEVASVSQGRGPSEIRRIAGERAIVLTARSDGIDLGTAKDRIQQAVAELRRENPEVFTGVVVDVAGQSEEAERSSRELLFALALALVMVYIVMASQFESLLDPLIIMISSVFAAVGAVFALRTLDISASVVVFIGLIMLAGIVVNNAIVLIDSINRLRRERGLSRKRAIIEGSVMRLRPILMTTTTTVLGLLPMALSTGEGAELRVPMAVTVMAGLTSSTVLTLLIIPCFHSLAHAFVDRLRGVTEAEA